MCIRDSTLGGAFTLKTKDGFTNEGVDAEILTGSYGRRDVYKRQAPVWMCKQRIAQGFHA